ncbi:methyltransferase type 12 [Desulfobacter hydrogenophilus]|uniref:Class I SAM-dependent methyltransferase n=1 Tax=Desulfobacter hydrogenophilus TaxID=2291 RepID=A0A328FIT9_9BACT|nr:class I SAM-dependent methyltransferase [Desulfobacter hydrogenophilus]NDY71051.1 class I SAM-dependent methyltransferase [Desulfobacter hydrogenophilus]QBH11694.1 class I SAM-dependent methyltransferase [Desulfobacter hydrogenophilus]RAM02907.1 methyltransferase type 12 [Desulfobacter hydrogenophilus]
MADFSDKLVQILNYGSLNLGLGIGYALEIFDVMDEKGSALTLGELSGATGLDMRYLKEWLGIMVTGGIIEMTKKPDNEDTFFLPPTHGDLLCRRAGNNNMGVYTQEIPLLTACAMDAVKQGFKTGQGVPFSIYPDFQAFMSELADAKHRKVLIQEFIPYVDQGRLEKRLQQGIRVCDLGCGQGVAACLMAQAYPKSEFIGMDNHEKALEQARALSESFGLSNIAFINQDAAKISALPKFNQYFDYVCAFDAIHDQSHPLDALKGVKYMLREGGLFSMIDIKAATNIKDNTDHPMGPFLYTVSLMHCMPIGLNDNGSGLGMMWGKQQAIDLLRQAGFSKVCAEEIPNDSFNLHFLCAP